MRSQKEVEKKIKEITDDFFRLILNNATSLRALRIQINALNWCLGKRDWLDKKVITNRKNGARLK